MDYKKKNILTMLLIIITAVIIGIIGYFGFELINGNVRESQAEDITDEFESRVPTITEEELANTEENNQGGTEESKPNNNSSGSSKRSAKKTSYGVNVAGYWVAGTIRIPATGIKYSIFSNPTAQALEKGIGILYTANGLNQAGNTVLAGHNYRNRLFFSKNKNLNVGDIIYIKDATGVELTYEVYNKFITNSQDASFYQRDTNGERELTLTTCTDQGTKTGERIIIFAREKVRKIGRTL